MVCRGVRWVGSAALVVIALAAGCRATDSNPPTSTEAPTNVTPATPRVDDWTQVSARLGEQRFLATGAIAFVGDAQALVTPPQGGAIELWDLDELPPTRWTLTADEPGCATVRDVAPDGELALGDGWICAIEPVPQPGPGAVSLRPLVEVPKGTRFVGVAAGDVRAITTQRTRESMTFRQVWPPTEGPLADGWTVDIDGARVGRGDVYGGLMICTDVACREATLLDAVEERWTELPAELRGFAIADYRWLGPSRLLTSDIMNPARVLDLTPDGRVQERCALGRDGRWAWATATEDGDRAGSIQRVLITSTMDSATVWRVEADGCVLERTLPAEGQWYRSALWLQAGAGLERETLWLGATPPSGTGTVTLRAIPMTTEALRVGPSDDVAQAIDWRPPPLAQLSATGPANEDAWPELRAEVELELDPADGRMRTEIRNDGPGESWLTRVQVLSDPPQALPGGYVEFPIGRLEPGESRTVEVALPIAPAWRGREVGLRVRWMDAHERSTGGTTRSLWPRLIADAEDERAHAEAILAAGVALLDHVTSEPQAVRGMSLRPDEYGFFTTSSTTIRYQQIHDMEPTPLAINREVWQARSRDELERLIAPMQWWLIPHELAHTRLGWSGWEHEFMAAWIGALMTRRLLEGDSDAPIRQASMVRFYRQVVTRLEPSIDPALDERLRAFMRVRGREEPPAGLFERFGPSTVLRDDPATYVWFLARVSLWALEQPDTLESLLAPTDP